jgi:hypothetical protein
LASRPGALKLDGRRGSSRRKWVSELINQESRSWDEAAVRECCLPHDADVILGIKLSARATGDFIAWSGEHNGLFSVRSAYRLGLQARLHSLSGGQSSAGPSGERRIWDLVWKAAVPPKLRVFAWKVATDSLGTKQNLNRRIPTVDPTCSLCGCKTEDSHHALIACTLARALREELRVHWSLPDESAFKEDHDEWIFSLLGNATKDQRPMIIFLLWRAWHHRNNIVHGDGKASVSASVPYLVNYHRSFTRVGDEALVKEAYWSPPPFGSIKVNVDAGWDSMSKMAGIGVIIRDHLGQPILAVWKPITGCASAQEAEVIACLEGLRHLIAIRRWPAVLESDCAWAPGRCM